jgi:hypothetical protein
MPSVEYHHSLPLSTNEFLAERRLSLASALRKLAFAKERVAIERLAELEIFHEALRSEAEETHSLPYRAQQAVALASAARDTVEAEKEVAKCEMVVVILLLAAKEGKMEEAGGRLNEAEKQYCTLVQSVLTKNLGPDSSDGVDVYSFEPQTRYPDRWPYSGVRKNESGGSDFESIDPGSPTSDSDD